MSEAELRGDSVTAKVADAARDGGTAAEAAQIFAEASPETSRSRTLVWQDPVPTAAAGATMTGMEYMQALVAGKMPPPPIAVTMRMGPIELGEGRAAARQPPRRASPQPTRASSSPTASPPA